MQNRQPNAPNGGAPVPDFAPVPRTCKRHDGWTPARQRAFIDALAELGSVGAACKRINMSTYGAYYLRRQPGADEFRAAWAAALDFGVLRLTAIAIDRATEGVPVPVFWRGEQVGEKRAFNDRLLMFVIKHHLPGQELLSFATRAAREGEAPEAAEAATRATDKWLTEHARAFGVLAAAHRRFICHAVLALLAGDHPSARDHESEARALERIMDYEPDGWTGEAGLQQLAIG
ncbi:MAG: hypothetical protein H0X36_14400 [Sphingomonadaceae bacterium]|nr:hypothetical protein [Sphingomonadaceae bacterium]